VTCVKEEGAPDQMWFPDVDELFGFDAAANGGEGGVTQPAPALRCHGEAVQLQPMKSMLKAPGTNLLTLKHGEPLSASAFKSNLRRYTMAAARGEICAPDIQTPPRGSALCTPTLPPRRWRRRRFACGGATSCTIARHVMHHIASLCFVS